MAGGVARSQGWLSRPDTGGAAWACAGATPVRLWPAHHDRGRRIGRYTIGRRWFYCEAEVLDALRVPPVA